MKIRKIAWQIVAGVMILVLAGAGAVPAKTICQDGCSCHGQTGTRRQLHQPDPGMSHGIRGLNFTGLRPSHHILIDMSTQHPACRTVPVETCRMSGTRPVGVLQRTVSGTVQTDPLSSGSVLAVLWQSVERGLSFHGDDLLQQPSFDLSDLSPVPLYLQNLSIIC
jgi:hypothetical protein